ncbi:hypothetical protein [uncultured Gammaproteobacteria bacterium]|nr:hypothetical protein [uncultured Gammaproteobacteria bacterium]CAC9637465.1 hypothetical protein [uncultured Gammaproteobacteria bacterium]VVH52310.1 hypothetical protein BPUTSESOX_2409 [uncultured Gammaproteobacteria bacterium]
MGILSVFLWMQDLNGGNYQKSTFHPLGDFSSNTRQSLKEKTQP